LFKEKIGVGSIRNKVCSFCDSGKKFKKCKCFISHRALISSVVPNEATLIQEYNAAKQLEKARKGTGR